MTFESAGILTRELRVRVIDISRSGCLVESQRLLDVGKVGTLRLQFGIDEYSDDILVVRCQAIEGGSVSHVGLRFLWTTSRHAGSIRYAVTRYAAEIGLRAIRVM